MIVADTNLLAYLHLPGTKSEVADDVLVKDPDWVSTPLWASEFRNILFAFVRTQGMPPDLARAHWQDAQTQMAGHVLIPDPEHILAKADSTSLSAYDAEYVALAEALGVRLVTSDKEILRHARGVACSPEAFVHG